MLSYSEVREIAFTVLENGFKVESDRILGKYSSIDKHCFDLISQASPFMWNPWDNPTLFVERAVDNSIARSDVTKAGSLLQAVVVAIAERSAESKGHSADNVKGIDVEIFRPWPRIESTIRYLVQVTTRDSSKNKDGMDKMGEAFFNSSRQLKAQGNDTIEGIFFVAIGSPKNDIRTWTSGKNSQYNFKYQWIEGSEAWKWLCNQPNLGEELLKQARVLSTRITSLRAAKRESVVRDILFKFQNAGYIDSEGIRVLP